MSARRRLSAWVLLLVMMAQIGMPTTVMALTSGPSQPETQGFQPVGNSDMVDLFSGDFSYNIPLLDVEGYPLNLAYSGGITMDQEASWVGLGWNINPGVVNRNLRGVPDDLAGENIVREMNVRPNRTIGMSLGVGVEIFGLNTDDIGLNLNAGVSPSLNNYTGMSFETNVGVSISLKSTKSGKSAFTGSLGLSSGSHSGVRLQPQIGFESTTKSQDGVSTKGSINVGLDIGSRKGLTDITFGVSAKSTAEYCHPTHSKYDDPSHSVSAGSSFNLGMPTYTPQLNMPMDNLSVSLNFTAGGELAGTHVNGRVGGFYSRQKLRDPIVSSPAYGYLYLDRGQERSNATLDFNREKDGPYTPEQAALGIAALTNDIFSVSAQGVSGSYRPYRAEVGHVFDQRNTCNGNSGTLGIEIGFGTGAHGGADILINSVNSWSGRWDAMNEVKQRMKFRGTSANIGEERVFFRNASEPVVEADNALYAAMGEDRAMRFMMSSAGGYDMRLRATLDDGDGVVDGAVPATNFRTQREPRAQVFDYRTDGEVRQGLGVDDPVDRPNSGFTIPSHHMSEVSVLDQKGGRYVFGLPAYNTLQQDVSFAVNAGQVDMNEELVPYSPTDASTGNTNGTDHYFSRATTPPYAHSFLLTSILSADYSDIDDEKGPSDGDLGTYTRFTYALQQAGLSSRYTWRTPVTDPGHARYERGRGATDKDDKASYVFGNKEVWYLENIITRNRIAVFVLNDDDLNPRKDALGVREDGAADPDRRSRFLERIELYDRHAYEFAMANSLPLPDPIKQVHFKYKYVLCPHTPNSIASDDGIDGGKLTLTEVFFTYGRSNKGVTSPYRFEYGNTSNGIENPSYDLGNQDRWGCLKPDKGSALATALLTPFPDALFHTLSTNQYPYATQEEEAADLLAKAWNVRTIRLPSGGEIRVELEADDYAYVQNKRAARMFPIHHIGPTTIDPPDPITGTENIASRDANRLYFLIPDAPSAYDDFQRFIEGQDLIYFRVRNYFDWTSAFDDGYDYVSGYAEHEGGGILDDLIDGKLYGYVDLKKVDLDENCNSCDKVSPIYRAAIEHARLNYPNELYAPPGFSDDASIGEQFLTSMASSISGLVTGLSAFFEGPNAEIVSLVTPNLNTLKVKMGESWIRLTEPDHQKKGGGHRVRSITIHDAWAAMENSGFSQSSDYKQTYTYGDAEGSYGVAAYEPMIGADENPFRRPVYHTTELLMSSDERFYQEEPFGESHFPSHMVGYSKVIVKDDLENVDLQAEQGTGTVVSEFYTAKDFPTITSRTGIAQERRKTAPDIFTLLGIRTRDHMHVSQGFVIENNDMHGKARSTTVYPEGSDEAVSQITYTYQTAPYGNALRLTNEAKVIHPDGSTGTATIGRNYEFYSDLREFGSNNTSGGVHANLELIYLGLLLLPIPPILPKYSSESTRFRSGVLVKRIDRFGLLEKVVKMENGSVISTENLAYDAQTGRVLLTRSNNEFDDPLYTLEFPAYWHYDGMGPAYRNLNATRTLAMDGNGWATQVDAQQFFARGDELAMWAVPPNSDPAERGWVSDLHPGAVQIIDKDGLPIAGSQVVKVVRSGRRNMQDVPMMKLTTKDDPLADLSGNAFSSVLQAEVVEFSDLWRTDCACLIRDPEDVGNPFRENRRGIWRLKRERAWLSDRTRSIMNGNTDIRRDGVFSAFDPFYKIDGDHWVKEPTGWTLVREVTDHSPRGEELENIDALGLYSSATFSHRGMLPNSVSRNSMHQESGFESFEATFPAHCADSHFRIDEGTFAIVTDHAHTGRTSIKVAEGDQAHMRSVLRECTPPPECGFTMVKAEIQNGYTVTPTGDGAPFTFSEASIMEGTPTLTPMAGNVLKIAGTGTWAVHLAIQNAEGCTVLMNLTNP